MSTYTAAQQSTNLPPIRIAHITTMDFSLTSLLLNQLRSLQQTGYEMVGISSPGEAVPVLEAAGIQHISVPITRTLTPLADLFSLWRLYRVMRRERFTIVHTHNPKPGLLGQLAARMAGVPIVVNTLHGFYFHDQMHPAWRRFLIVLEAIAARCSDIILSQNREDMRMAVRERICPSRKIKHLGNGIDLNQFDPHRFSAEEIARRKEELGIPAGAPVVGFIGRLAAKRKGFLDFLAAAQKVSAHHPGVRFLIVGHADPGASDAVEPSVAKSYGIAEQCLFLGSRPYEELPLLHKLIDVLVLPSVFEGIPRVVMEASAMEVPSVVTDVKGNREAVEAGRNGSLVPLGDVSALADAICELLEDSEKAQRMGKEGRRIALERFDERLVFEKVKAEYARLLQEQGLLAPQPKASSLQVRQESSL
jgi:glycosyltransferase involved in cell wall biosynthesis